MSSLSEALDLVAADGRRPVTEAERTQILGFWGEAFRGVHTDDVRKAVLTWLSEHPRGRPTVGELHAVVKRFRPAEEKKKAESAAQKHHELSWAVSILEAPSRYQTADYQHTLETAEHYVRQYGYSDWQDAKAWLVPGWAPATVTEVYL